MFNKKTSISEAINRHSETVKTLEWILPDIQNAAFILLETLSGGGKIVICGNGGSAADSQHFATEFTCKYKDSRRPLPAIALTTDTSALTAIGNDYGFEYVFSRQIEALGQEGDILVAITTSGSSKNVLVAIEEAKRKKMKVIVMTGLKGDKLRSFSDAAIVVRSEETARIQEMHELIIHSWCEFIDEKLK